MANEMRHVKQAEQDKAAAIAEEAVRRNRALTLVAKNHPRLTVSSVLVRQKYLLALGLLFSVDLERVTVMPLWGSPPGTASPITTTLTPKARRPSAPDAAISPYFRAAGCWSEEESLQDDPMAISLHRYGKALLGTLDRDEVSLCRCGSSGTSLRLPCSP